MAKSLIITEKPSVARDIVQALGGFSGGGDNDHWERDDLVCTFAVGHILELLEPQELDPAYKQWKLDNLPILPDDYLLKPKEGQVNRVRAIKKLMDRRDVDTLINACDAGREGELIFREIVRYHKSTKPIRRLWLQSMTPQAIRDGFNRLQDGRRFDGLADAAECRAMADYVIGMNATRALTVRLRNKMMKVWTAGRVQTPTLALLVERELEILRFIPEPYWQVTGEFKAPTHTYQGLYFDPQFKESEQRPQAKADRIFDKERAEGIALAVATKQGAAKETRRPSNESPRPLFDLTSLQREANGRFGWPASMTLAIAQACYERFKTLTYPRTSSKCLPNDYVGHVENVLDVLSREPDYSKAAQFLQKNGRQNDKKVFNDAGVSDHFAIIPTGVIDHNMPPNEQKLFDMVTRRFLAAFHPNAVWEQVERVTVVEGHHFRSRSRTLKEPGWREVYYNQKANQGEGEDKGLPALVPGQAAAENVPVTAVTTDAPEDVTRPPGRYTEAGLLSLMENAGKHIDDEELAAVMSGKGLGTPATRAEIIEKLKRTSYVDKSLRPTSHGIRFIDMLKRMEAERLASAELTGEMELHLTEVERGQRTRDDFLGEIRDYATQIVDAARTFTYDEIYPNDRPCGSCPCDLKRPVHERGFFYRCEETDAAPGSEGDCPFRVWKDIKGRYIDTTTVSLLLRDGRTGELEGFLDQGGRPYTAKLALRGKEVVVEAAGAEALPAEGLPVNEEPLADCPIHDDGDCKVVETPVAFCCTTYRKDAEGGRKNGPGINLPRVVCQREISRDEAVEFVLNGQTPLIEDFISRFKKPFKATLKRKENGRFEFEFPPREPKAGGRGRWGKKAADGEGDGAAGADGASADGQAPAAGKRAAPKAAKAAAKKAPAKKAAKAPAKRTYSRKKAAE